MWNLIKGKVFYLHLFHNLFVITIAFITTVAIAALIQLIMSTITATTVVMTICVTHLLQLIFLKLGRFASRVIVVTKCPLIFLHCFVKRRFQI